MTEKVNFNSKVYKAELMSPKGSHDGLHPISRKSANAYANVVSILGKRNFNDAFENTTFDDARYGQNISTDFFKKNVGHDVIQSNTKAFTYEEEQEILQWCDYYRANRNLF